MTDEWSAMTMSLMRNILIVFLLFFEKLVLFFSYMILGLNGIWNPNKTSITMTVKMRWLERISVLDMRWEAHNAIMRELGLRGEEGGIKWNGGCFMIDGEACSTFGNGERQIWWYHGAPIVSHRFVQWRLVYLFLCSWKILNVHSIQSNLIFYHMLSRVFFRKILCSFLKSQNKWNQSGEFQT